MTQHRWLLPIVLLGLTACSGLPGQSSATEAALDGVIRTFKRAEFKSKSGLARNDFPLLLTEVRQALVQLPADTPPRVAELLQSAGGAYGLAFTYWQCDLQPVGVEQANCRDSELEKILTRFPRIKRNITQRLITRPNPPQHLSEVVSTVAMVRLLLMQAELNRVDAHLILTGGRFDNVYSSTEGEVDSSKSGAGTTM